MPAATLRTWQARYGAPAPQRLPGGHRRYTEQDVALIDRIQRHRREGLGLAAAVERATTAGDEAEPSVFAGLRRRHPGLVPHVLRKPTLLALTRALEDECCAQADRPLLFASFQRERFYRQSAGRWRELARTARTVVVFADFPASAHAAASGGRPLRVPLPSEAPLRREWALVCDAADHPAALAGWEIPAERVVTDAERRFETVWSTDPLVVRDAARIAAGLADRFAPGHGLPLGDQLAGRPRPASPDLARATGLFDRMLAYLEAAGRD